MCACDDAHSNAIRRADVRSRTQQKGGCGRLRVLLPPSNNIGESEREKCVGFFVEKAPSDVRVFIGEGKQREN